MVEFINIIKCMIEFIKEIYQILFILSILVIIHNMFILGIKIYNKFRLSQNTTFILETKVKILLWFSIAIIFSYLIN